MWLLSCGLNLLGGQGMPQDHVISDSGSKMKLKFLQKFR